MKTYQTLATSPEEIWRASVTDEQQKKLPLKIGVALALGVFLWLGPYLGINAVLLPARIAEIAPLKKEGVIALLAVSAMVVATLANIIFGALSDLTRSRWGRRTPWIIIGSISSSIMLIIIGRADSITILLITWCIYQFCLNAIVAPLLAVIADRIAPRHRGSISSVYAIGYSVGLYGGQIVGAQFLGNIPLGFIVMALATLVSGPIAAYLMKEPSSLDMPKIAFDKKMILNNFSFPLKKARDYYLALFGKFFILSAVFSISGYQLYILTDYMSLSMESSSYYVSIISLFLMLSALIMSAVSGPISDKLKIRRLPVVISAIFIAIGTIIPIFSSEPWTMLIYGIIAGIGMGAFNAVDQALNVEVLPNPETAAKDLGILNLANTGGQILGPVMAAASITAIGYHAIFPLAAGFALTGAILIMCIRSVR